MKKSMSVVVDHRRSDKSQLNRKLTKLNERNEGLRKELIKISSDLTGQLKNKKFVPKNKELSPEKKELSRDE
jgi:hypothetical protein